jgi:hypothetical protein
VTVWPLAHGGIRSPHTAPRISKQSTTPDNEHRNRQSWNRP